MRRNDERTAGARRPPASRTRLLLVATAIVLLAGWAFFGSRSDRAGASAPPSVEEPAPEDAPELEESARIPAPRKASPPVVGASEAVETVQPEDARPAEEITISGLVHDLAGAPVVGAGVTVRARWKVQAHSRTDSTGHYSMRTKFRGRCYLRAFEMEHLPHDRSLVLTDDRPERREDFVLQPYRIVRVDLVTPDGEPARPALESEIAGLWVNRVLTVATREDPGDTFVYAPGSLTKRHGCGRLMSPSMARREPPGPETVGYLYLEDPGPVWASLVVDHRVVDKRLLGADEDNVRFELGAALFERHRATLRGSVVAAEDGSPLAAVVGFSTGPGTDQRGTEEHGRFALELPHVARGLLYVVSAGRATYQQIVLPPLGGELDLGTIALHVPARLSGRVSPVERLVPEFEVVARPVPGLDAPWVPNDTLRPDEFTCPVDEDGGYRFDGLAPGSYEIRVRYPIGKQEVPCVATEPIRVTLVSGEERELTLPLLRATPVWLELTDVPAGWGVDLDVRTADGLLAARWVHQWSNGEKEFALPPGFYQVELVVNGERRSGPSLDVSEEAFFRQIPIGDEAGD